MTEMGPEELLAEVEEAMHDVIDPEIGINVMDLGLVYDVSLRQDEGGPTAVVVMTLTSPACPLQDMITEQLENATVGAGLVKKVDLNWTWEPPWGPHLITDEGREMMRAVGFTV